MNNLEYWKMTKQQAMQELTKARQIIEDVKIDAACLECLIENCDHEIANDQMEKREKKPMYGKARLTVMAAIALLLIIVWVSSCATLKGGLTDSAWIAQKLADNINTKEK
ncbi:MAG: hypothetical protein MUO31_13190 [Thermodesulfovibrionales bacterium]|nr:hypothetical protein [Thermodesulfovibrionales bacterium]